jgi:deoxyadenosine/deoxycytidine kinase
VIAEPVAEWQSISNKHNLLQQYYDNPTRWAFTFQINAILSRMTLLNKLL